MNKPKPTILLITCIHSRNAFLRKILEAEGLNVKAAASVFGGLQMVKTIRPQIIIMDISSMDACLMEHITLMNQRSGSLLIVLSKFTRSNDIHQVFEKGAFDFLSHPINVFDLKNKIWNALEYLDYQKYRESSGCLKQEGS